MCGRDALSVFVVPSHFHLVPERRGFMDGLPSTQKDGPPNNETLSAKEAAPLTIEQLAGKVENLKRQIDKETTGFTGKVKWLGLVVALLVGILTVPKAAKDTWEAYFSRPDTAVTPESSLLMSYDPTTKMIEFGFGFTIE